MNSSINCYGFINSGGKIEYRDNFQVKIPIPDLCPVCNKSIVPAHIFSSFIYGSKDVVSSTFLCPSCENYLYSQVVKIGNHYEGLCLLPYPISITEMSKDIQTISPNFVNIYSQAEQAEAQNLNEICGMGYRKALEFLIKDFAILQSKSDDEIEKIKSETLSQCISNHFDNKKLRTLAQAATWLGNDETHYQRKHPEYNVNELKAFIAATLTYIENEIAFAKATELIDSSHSS